MTINSENETYYLLFHRNEDFLLDYSSITLPTMIMVGVIIQTVSVIIRRYLIVPIYPIWRENCDVLIRVNKRMSKDFQNNLKNNFYSLLERKN